MGAEKRFYEKLVWGTDVPFYEKHIKAGKLHKVALLAGIKLSKSYAPHLKIAFIPKVLHAPAEAVPSVGGTKARASATVSVARLGQKQSAGLVKLGSFGYVHQSSKMVHQAYKTVRGHMIGNVVKFHMAPKDEKSFAPVRVSEMERRTGSILPQVQQPMGTGYSVAEGQELANAWGRNRSVHQQMLNTYHMATKGDEVKAKKGGGSWDSAAEQDQAVSRTQDFEDMLEAYFLRQSRLPPAGGTGVNPKLSPLWAGLKIPM